MDETVQSLQAELQSLKVANNTYNREYQDRIEAGQMKIDRPGFQTTQDLVLAWFFGSYLLMILLLCIYMVRYTRQKITNVVSVLAVSTLFGLITAYVLLQLG